MDLLILIINGIKFLHTSSMGWARAQTTQEPSMGLRPAQTFTLNLCFRQWLVLQAGGALIGPHAMGIIQDVEGGL